MIERELIAERTIYAIDKDSREFEIRLMVGKPYQTDFEHGDWACPAAMIGLHGVFPDVYGVDSWQALTLALNLIRKLLIYFVEDGGKLYWDENGNEISIDEIFDMKSEIPFPNKPLTPEQEARVERLTTEEIDLIDSAMMADASVHWRKVARVVGTAMMANADRLGDVPDTYYALRLRKLVDEGRLISQGNLEYIRFSEVKLPGSA